MNVRIFNLLCSKLVELRVWNRDIVELNFKRKEEEKSERTNKHSLSIVDGNVRINRKQTRYVHMNSKF